MELASTGVNGSTQALSPSILQSPSHSLRTNALALLPVPGWSAISYYHKPQAGNVTEMGPITNQVGNQRSQDSRTLQARGISGRLLDFPTRVANSDLPVHHCLTLQNVQRQLYQHLAKLQVSLLENDKTLAGAAYFYEVALV